MRTVGFLSALVTFGALTGCLGTRDGEVKDASSAQASGSQGAQTPFASQNTWATGYGANQQQGQYGQPQGTQAAPAPQQAALPLQAMGFPAIPGFPGSAPAADPSQQPQQGQQQPAPQAAPANPGGFPGMPMLPFPGGGQSSPGQASGSAQPIDPNAAMAATVPLMAYAVQEAPGMQREGGIVAGYFREGQTLEQPVSLQPNKCYTVLAVGAGISEVHIALVAVTPIPMASPILAQDQGNGASASLGGRGNCYKWPAPIGINAKYVVKASKGQGIAAAQLYTK